jgi:hypothetical protein
MTVPRSFPIVTSRLVSMRAPREYGDTRTCRTAPRNAGSHDDTQRE